ncbi:glutamate--tRNA ligase [bacterium]|nr:glutamate--tRNA ligase [bacterium]MBU1984614.1 glutamate--tRNA ligase [bacterium]
MSEIRVRFAPSPTGYLHVGGARTAIFNYLFARSAGGRFLLRIEDTDPVRSRGELAQVILDGLRWLGIESDEPVVYQSDRKARFVEIAQELIRRGYAYPDFTTPEDLERMRKESQARREPMFRFKADPDAARAEASERLARGEPHAVRFASPADGVAWDDLVHGPIEFRGEEIEDFVLLRSEGSPTYHLSVVCDDHDMAISHVLRGDDHVSNTPKQILIYRAMDWVVPKFGHVPLILGPDKQRLSKRTGAASVGEFHEKGFLPQALFNFLTLLGWSPGPGDRELFTRDELFSCFQIEGIQPKSAVFDIAKLEWMNGEHLRMLADSDALDYLILHAPDSGVTREQLARVWPLVRPRIRLPRDLYEDHAYFFHDPVDYDPKGVEKHFQNPAVVKAFTEYHSELTDVNPFEEAALEAQLRTFCEAREMSAGKLIHPIRLALTGKTVSPGLFEMMVALGRETVLRRLDAALKKLVAS